MNLAEHVAKYKTWGISYYEYDNCPNGKKFYQTSFYPQIIEQVKELFPGEWKQGCIYCHDTGNGHFAHFLVQYINREIIYIFADLSVLRNVHHDKKIMDFHQLTQFFKLLNFT